MAGFEWKTVPGSDHSDHADQSSGHAHGVDVSSVTAEFRRSVRIISAGSGVELCAADGTGIWVEPWVEHLSEHLVRGAYGCGTDNRGGYYWEWNADGDHGGRDCR